MRPWISTVTLRRMCLCGNAGRLRRIAAAHRRARRSAAKPRETSYGYNTLYSFGKPHDAQEPKAGLMAASLVAVPYSA